MSFCFFLFSFRLSLYLLLARSSFVVFSLFFLFLSTHPQALAPFFPSPLVASCLVPLLVPLFTDRVAAVRLACVEALSALLPRLPGSDPASSLARHLLFHAAVEEREGDIRAKAQEVTRQIREEARREAGRSDEKRNSQDRKERSV